VKDVYAQRHSLRIEDNRKTARAPQYVLKARSLGRFR
jgi:hypothetical protein